MEYRCQLIVLLMVISSPTSVTSQFPTFIHTVDCQPDRSLRFTALKIDTSTSARFAYVFDCASTVGENSGNGYPITGQSAATFYINQTECALEWDTLYSTVMTINQGAVILDDLPNVRPVMCYRQAATVNVTSQLNIAPAPANSVNVQTIKPPIMTTFTAASDNFAGTPVLEADLDQQLKYHVWIPAAYTGSNAFGIAVHTLTAISGGKSVTLIGGTEPGCKSHPLISEPQTSAGYVGFDLTVFYLAGSTSDVIRFETVVLLCNGTCPAWTCSSPIARKRRNVDNDNNNNNNNNIVDAQIVNGYLELKPRAAHSAPERNYDVTTQTVIQDVTSDVVTSCETCADTAIYVVIGVLVAAILFSVTISLFLFRRFSRLSSGKRLSDTDNGKYT